MRGANFFTIPPTGFLFRSCDQMRSFRRSGFDYGAQTGGTRCALFFKAVPPFLLLWCGTLDVVVFPFRPCRVSVRVQHVTFAPPLGVFPPFLPSFRQSSPGLPPPQLRRDSLHHRCEFGVA